MIPQFLTANECSDVCQNAASHLDCLLLSRRGGNSLPGLLLISKNFFLLYHVHVDEDDNFGSPVIEMARYLSVVWPKLQHGRNLPGCRFFTINCVPLRIFMLKPNPQCDDIRRWSTSSGWVIGS